MKPILLKENTHGKETMRSAREAAQGKYIALVESDDFWCCDEKLQLQYDFLEENAGYSAVVGLINVVDIDGNRMEQPLTIKKGYETNIITKESFSQRPYVPFIQSLMYRNKKEFLDTLKEYSNIDEPHVGDNFLQAMLLCDGPIFIMEKELACYRYIRNGGSFSSQSIPKKGRSLFNTAVSIKEFFSDQIDATNLIDGALSDMVYYGWRGMSQSEKNYYHALSLKRKITIFMRFVRGFFVRFVTLLRSKASTYQSSRRST